MSKDLRRPGDADQVHAVELGASPHVAQYPCPRLQLGTLHGVRFGALGVGLSVLTI